jgi:aspartyl-tRNA(Asn)/glutamyl-tRNA(Gln) amidotransferase subunit C
MIDRGQVIHVAKLAQIRFGEDEVEQIAVDLSRVLEHVERIRELDLDGIVPTSHVVSLENVFRSDEPEPSWPRSVALGQAPDPDQDAFRVPPTVGSD